MTMTAFRNSVRPLAVCLLGAAVAMTSLAASAFQQEGKLIAGSDVTFFPYEYMDNNKPAGFDIEFMDGLGKVMGRKVETLDTRFPILMSGLQAGRFDLTNSSM